MSDYYFILQEMSALRSYIPIIQEYNKLGARSSFIIFPKDKYNSPSKHKEYLRKICLDNKIATIDFNYFRENFKDKTIFSVEAKRVITYDKEPVLDAQENRIHSLPSQFDFLYCYPFQKKVKLKNIFQISRSICDYYRIQDERFVFSGDPKYSINLNSDEIKKKYGIDAKSKIALLVKPEVPFGVPDQEIYNILDYLRSMNICSIIKSRGKYSIEKSPKMGRKADYVFEDFSWHPHDMMELIEISDLCINMDSTASLEMAVGRTPFINYRVADIPHVKAFAKTVGLTERVCNFVYNYGFCKDNDHFVDSETFKKQVEYLLEENHNLEFDRIKEEYLFDKSKTLSKIITTVGF